MTTKNKESLNGTANTIQMKIGMKDTDNNCNTMLLNKINTQSDTKLNKTISWKSVPLSEKVCSKGLSVPPNLLPPYMVTYENQRRAGKKNNMYTINNEYFAAWKIFYLVFLLLSNWTLVQSASTEPSGIRIDPDDGGYTGIVFEIKEEVPEESCAEILKNLKVRFLLYIKFVSSSQSFLFFELLDCFDYSRKNQKQFLNLHCFQITDAIVHVVFEMQFEMMLRD